MVGPHDPLWLTDDLDIAMAYRVHEAERCPGCGTFGWEWEADRDAYGGGHSDCRGCAILEAEQDNIADLSSHARAGVRPVLRRPTSPDRKGVTCT